MSEPMTVAFLDNLFESSGSLPSPELLDYYERLKRREIFLNGEIDDGVVDWGLQILQWNREDKDTPVDKRVPIRVYINSDGGNLPAIMNMIDMIKMSKTPVYTIGMSRCYSSGGLLLMAGHKRYICPETSFLLHDGYGGGQQSTAKLMDSLNFTKEQEVRVKKYVLEVTKITGKMYDANYRKDWFMFAEDIIKYGIADEIVSSLDVLL